MKSWRCLGHLPHLGLGVALWILWQLTPSPPSVIDNQTFTRIHRWSSCELVDFPVVVQPLSQCGLSDRGGNAFFGAIIVEVAILAQVEQSLRSQRSFAPTRPKHSHCLGWVVACSSASTWAVCCFSAEDLDLAH